MMIRPSASIFVATFAGLLAGAGPAIAQDLAADAEPIASTQVRAEASASVFGAQAVSEATLQANAGREDISQVSQAQLRAGVSQNSVGDNAVTGAATIDGNAFQNMSGLSILNVNTGNNVAINAAMNVNISISPAP